jgi:hypothetical protein
MVWAPFPLGGKAALQAVVRYARDRHDLAFLHENVLSGLGSTIKGANQVLAGHLPRDCVLACCWASAALGLVGGSLGGMVAVWH